MKKKPRSLNKKFDIVYILESCPGYVYWKDIHSIYRGCNRNLAVASGLSSPQAINGMTDYDFRWAKKSAEKFVEGDQLVMETGKSIIAEHILPVTNPEGKNYIIRTEKSPLYDKDKKIIGVLGNAIDITADKENEMLRKQKELAEKEAQLMHLMAGMVTHELKTPIAEMDFAMQSVNPAFKKDHHFNMVKRSVLTLNNTVDMILTKLRYLSEKNFEKEKEQFYSCSIIQSIEATLKAYPFTKVERKKLHWTKPKYDFNYWGDSFLTQHILFNLIRNAFDAIKEAGKGEITIAIKLGKKMNYLIFEDTGLGISSKFLPHIFEKFTTQGLIKKGTGLGLSFCQIVMQAYGGDIVCESKEREYARFILNFPK